MLITRLVAFKKVVSDAGKFSFDLSHASSFTLIVFLSIMTIGLLLSKEVYAGHPLSTDDTGTQGKGKAEFDVHSEFIFDKRSEDGMEFKTRGGELRGTLIYGLSNNVDVSLGIPYMWGKVKENGLTIYDEKGLSDISIELKWRFYELENVLSFALKPSITIPTGDYKNGLGSGKATYGITFIATKELKPCAFHFNAGYTYNDNKLDERKDLWKVSAATEVEVIKNLKIVGEVGMGKNPDKLSNTNPAFVTGGVIYSVAENIDIDIGIRAGLNRAEPDMAVLVGINLKF